MFYQRYKSSGSFLLSFYWQMTHCWKYNQIPKVLHAFRLLLVNFPSKEIRYISGNLISGQMFNVHIHSSGWLGTSPRHLAATFPGVLYPRNDTSFIATTSSWSSQPPLPDVWWPWHFWNRSNKQLDCWCAHKSHVSHFNWVNGCGPSSPPAFYLQGYLSHFN